MTVRRLTETNCGQSAFPAGTHRQGRRQRVLHGLCLLLGLYVFGGCKASQNSTAGSRAVRVAIADANAKAAPSKPEERRMWMTVGQRRFGISLDDNESARAFAALFPLALEMGDLNGNEKHVTLPKALPTTATRPGTIRSGDLMLYGSNTLVVFYETFESAYSYTRLGRVDDQAALAQAVGQGDVRIVFLKN